MTKEFPVYARLLPLLSNAIVVDFPSPQPRDSLIAYVERMAHSVPANSFVAGISFGGIVALEIARIICPLGCILISSIRHPNELPPWFRICRALGGRRCSAAMKIIGRLAKCVPRSVSTTSTLRATKLAGPSGSWHRWATAAVLDWHPEPGSCMCPILQIHGSADSTFPIRYTHPDISIPGGVHALPVSHPRETAAAIRTFIGDCNGPAAGEATQTAARSALRLEGETERNPARWLIQPRATTYRRSEGHSLQ